MLALPPLPFEVRWFDEREDAFPSALPHNACAVPSHDAVDALRKAPSEAFVVVMTHSHPLDYALVHCALLTDRLPYVGLIGSAGKRARFTRRMRAAGVEERQLNRLVCPIGISGINSKHPAAIAAAATAELLVVDEACSADRHPHEGLLPGRAGGRKPQ